MRNLILLVSLLSVAACGGDNPPTVTSFTHLGTWTLTRVGGQSVPVKGNSTSCGGLVESGALTLRENGTYTLLVKYGPAPCVSEYGGSGSYTITNDRDIALQNTAGTPIRMAYFGFIIDWTRNGVLHEWTKP